MFERILNLIKGDFERDGFFMEKEEFNEYKACVEFLEKLIKSGATSPDSYIDNLANRFMAISNDDESTDTLANTKYDFNIINKLYPAALGYIEFLIDEVEFRSEEDK